MFFDLLNIKTPEWYQTFISGRRLTSKPPPSRVFTLLRMFVVYRRSRQAPENEKQPEAPERAPETLKLTDQYIALLVLLFTNAGLLDVSANIFFWWGVLTTRV
jgi:rapamycin-insensitive companion of mTOR